EASIRTALNRQRRAKQRGRGTWSPRASNHLHLRRATKSPFPSLSNVRAKFGMAMLLACASVPASAQEPRAPTAAQVELYESAHRAFEADDHAGAIRLLQSALSLGELNILYVSLGRALYRAGRCEAADAAYERAVVAPAVVQPDV